MIALLFACALAADAPITWQNCTGGTCSQQRGFIVLDSGWRGADLSSAGVTVSGDSVSQKFKTGNSVGSRLYLLDSTENAYVKFKLVNAELTYDIDISQIPCGMNAAIYTAEMPAQGTGSGARNGAGYCDANYVGGEGCAEFDIGESNARATVYTCHGCNVTGHAPKGQINCDTNGGAANPYQVDKNFYGNGSSFTIDTSKKFTVVTQFIGSDNKLTEVKRKYVQGGKLYDQPNSLTTGLDAISPSLAIGHVLIWALWASDTDMAWMDAGSNGPCSSNNESTTYLQQNYPNVVVTYGNIKYGDIDSTYSAS